MEGFPLVRLRLVLSDLLFIVRGTKQSGEWSGESAQPGGILGLFSGCILARTVWSPFPPQTQPSLSTFTAPPSLPPLYFRYWMH